MGRVWGFVIGSALLAAACQMPNGSAEHTAVFRDDFARPNTEAGLGVGWEVYGPQLGQPSNDAVIYFDGQNSSYSYLGDRPLYAVRQIPGVQRVETQGQWRSIRPGGDTTIILAISPNLVTEAVQLAVNRSGWRLENRSGGDSSPIKTGRFSPPLELGRSYQFGMEISTAGVRIQVPGELATAFTPATSGSQAVWGEIPTPAPAGVVFDFDTVSAS